MSSYLYQCLDNDMDKIYSRPRIRFKKKKHNREQKIKSFILCIIIIFLVILVVFIKAAYPIFIVSCENAASSAAINILNNKVNEAMILYNYDDLVQNYTYK